MHARNKRTGFTLVELLIVMGIIVLAAGLVLGGLTIVLWVLAVMTAVTTLHRLYVTWQRLQGPDPESNQT